MQESLLSSTQKTSSGLFSGENFSYFGRGISDIKPIRRVNNKPLHQFRAHFDRNSRKHYITHETEKDAVIIHAFYNFFFTTATIFSIVLYMGNDFAQHFFQNSFAVTCVICKKFLNNALWDTL